MFLNTTEEMRKRIEAMETAREKLKDYNVFNTIPWRIIRSKETAKEMADSIRIYSHKGLIPMEKIYYKNPEHIIQRMIECEQLAEKIESLEPMAARQEINNYAGL